MRIKVRGVFERPPGSGVWWAQYFADGKRHRERVGRKSDAIRLYQTRKAEAHAGVKLPKLRNSRSVSLAELIDDALLRVQDHRDLSGYKGKAVMVRREMGHKPAAQITPMELDSWLGRFKTAATSNRYKAFLSLCYQEGVRNGKVSVNVARLARHRKEPKGRQRFLSRPEYDRLKEIVSRQFPCHLAELVVSVHTGMRLSEQYTVTWKQFDAERRVIELDKTKNGDARTVHLNQAAMDAIISVRPKTMKPADVIFTSTTKDFTTRAWFHPALMAAEIDSYVWHNNRHTFCSWLAMAGASIKEIQEAAGHKSIQMAARYAHLSPAHTGSVVERITSAHTF